MILRTLGDAQNNDFQNFIDSHSTSSRLYLKRMYISLQQRRRYTKTLKEEIIKKY